MSGFPDVVLVTFGDGDFRYRRAASRLVSEAKLTNCYKDALKFSVEDIRRLDPAIHSRIMRWLRTGNLKGIGYWTWKSVIIRETARKFPKSLIHYVDAGHVFLSSSSTRKKLHGWFAEAFDLGGLAWSLPGHQEIEWTKRETLFRLDPQLKLKCTDQIEGGFVLIPSGTALEFSNELRQIHLEQDGFFLTDEQFEAPFLEFKSHRHDQSIHSLVWKSMGLHSRETETSPPGPCDTMLAARHASGYPYSEKKQPIKQKMEFFLGKLHKAFLIFYGRAFSALNQAD